MDVQELLAEARDAMTARRVYGEPYERDGMTVIPAAVIREARAGARAEARTARAEAAASAWRPGRSAPG